MTFIPTYYRIKEKKPNENCIIRENGFVESDDI